MTFRETDGVTTIEASQFRGGSTEPKRRGRQPQVSGKNANPPVDDGQYIRGVSIVAAPVRMPNGSINALVVVGEIGRAHV